MLNKLALLGGNPIRESSIPWVNTMGIEELKAVTEVMELGALSSFIGRSGEGFLGGERVKHLETAFAEKFNSAYAISVNSATTALHTAIAACEIGPGDEVLVTPFTMVATASAVLMNNAIPIFVDIDDKTYNLNPREIEQWITPRTKAIVVANIFGLPAYLPEILNIANKHNLYVIEDNAQSPGAYIDGKYAGTFGNLSIFSLNYHKIIHSGEGGIILTNDPKLARGCQLIRNHGEMILSDENDYDTVALGSNYRMSELHAAIGIEQLKKLDGFLIGRRKLAKQITEGLKMVEGLSGVYIPDGYEHAYYTYPIQYNKEEWGISRETFAMALKAEGYPIGAGYQKPIYLLPMFQHKKVYNQTTYPFSLIDEPIQAYNKGLCPVTEDMYENKLLVADVCRLPFTESDIANFLTAIEKVWNNRGQLLTYEKNNISCS